LSGHDTLLRCDVVQVARLKSVSLPRTAFWFVKQPSWQTAPACGESPEYARPSEMRSKPNRQRDRGINFICGVFIGSALLSFELCAHCSDERAGLVAFISVPSSFAAAPTLTRAMIP